jgi:hypothetical protein
MRLKVSIPDSQSLIRFVFEQDFERNAINMAVAKEHVSSSPMPSSRALDAAQKLLGIQPASEHGHAIFDNAFPSVKAVTDRQHFGWIDHI